MSDTSTEDELPMAEGASPFTIPLSPEVRKLIDLAGVVGEDGSMLAQKIGRAEAEQLVYSRVYQLFAQNTEQGWSTKIPVFGTPEGPGLEEMWLSAAVADMVVGSLSDEDLVDAALAGIDLRPYLATAAENPEFVRANAHTRDILTASGDPLDDPTLVSAAYEGDDIDVAAVANQAIEFFNADQVAVITEQREAAGEKPLTEAELLAINDFGPDMVGTTPVSKVLANQPTLVTNPDGTQDVQSLTIEEILAGAGDDVLEGPPVLDRATIEQWARSGITDLDTIASQEAEAYQNGTLAPGETIYGFDVGQYRGGGPRRGPVRAGATMSAVEAIDYLHNMDDATFTAMQDKLARAGYFERIGARPERGYQWDEATNNAWRLALQDSLMRGVSLPEMVDQMANELTTRKQQRMQAFSIKDTRIAANQMAMEVLGRNLTGEEYDVVRGFLKNLQNDRRDDVLGIDPMSWQREGMDMDMGFDANDIQQGVERAIGGEADAQASYDTLRRLNDFLGLGGPTEGLDS